MKTERPKVLHCIKRAKPEPYSAGSSRSESDRAKPAPYGADAGKIDPRGAGKDGIRPRKRDLTPPLPQIFAFVNGQHCRFTFGSERGRLKTSKK